MLAEDDKQGDIFRQGDPVALIGDGWHPVEYASDGKRFRWIARNARLNVAQLTRSPYVIVMETEPGPSAGSKPFTLAAYEDDVKLTSASVAGKVELRLPGVPKPLIRELTLRVEMAAPPIAAPGDPRDLSYRIFSLRLVREQADVVPPGIAVKNGWYPLETFAGETFRWVGTEATIEIESPNGSGGTLALELEPGPGVGSGPFDLKVDYGNLQPLTIKIKSRQQIEVPYARGIKTIKLHAQGGGRRLPSDPRVLDFRVFSLRE